MDSGSVYFSYHCVPGELENGQNRSVAAFQKIDESGDFPELSNGKCADVVLYSYRRIPKGLENPNGVRPFTSFSRSAQHLLRSIADDTGR